MKEIKKSVGKELVKVSVKGLLSLVSLSLRGKTLFPQKDEQARQYLKGAKIELTDVKPVE